MLSRKISISLLGILKRYLRWPQLPISDFGWACVLLCPNLVLCERKEAWESCTHQPCFEPQFLFRVSLLIASRCLIAEQSLSAPVRLAEYLLSVFVRLESVWLLAEGLLIVGTFHCYSSFAKFSFGRECRQLQIPILRNQCTFFFFGRAEGGFLISERDSWLCFWRSYLIVFTGDGMASCF